MKTMQETLDKMKDELKARDIYQKAAAMLASPKPKEQAAGREAMAALAKKMPETVYGAKAATLP